MESPQKNIRNLAVLSRDLRFKYIPSAKMTTLTQMKDPCLWKSYFTAVINKPFGLSIFLLWQIFAVMATGLDLQCPGSIPEWLNWTRSQGCLVGHTLECHPGNLGLTPAPGNPQRVKMFTYSVPLRNEDSQDVLSIRLMKTHLPN